MRKSSPSKTKPKSHKGVRRSANGLSTGENLEQQTRTETAVGRRHGEHGEAKREGKKKNVQKSWHRRLQHNCWNCSLHMNPHPNLKMYNYTSVQEYRIKDGVFTFPSCEFIIRSMPHSKHPSLSNGPIAHMAVTTSVAWARENRWRLLSITHSSFPKVNKRSGHFNKVFAYLPKLFMVY